MPQGSLIRFLCFVWATMRLDCRRKVSEAAKQCTSKYYLAGSNPRPMAHKTIALCTELRDPCLHHA